MSKQKNTVAYVWKDRKHWAWFPFSFTVYAVADERLHITRGFFSKTYDETLLYRITDLTLRRSFAQRIFGTGTIVLNTLVDKDKTIELINIKKSVQTRHLLSQLIEDARRAKNVVGKEFYSDNCDHPDIPSTGSDFDRPDFDGPDREE